MKFDTNGVVECAQKFANSFSSLQKDLNDIIDRNKVMCRTDNWDTKTKAHYEKLYAEVIENYFVLNDKYNNIMEYIMQVIDNYQIVSSGSYRKRSR